MPPRREMGGRRKVIAENAIIGGFLQDERRSNEGASTTCTVCATGSAVFSESVSKLVGTASPRNVPEQPHRDQAV